MRSSELARRRINPIILRKLENMFCNFFDWVIGFEILVSFMLETIAGSLFIYMVERGKL